LRINKINKKIKSKKIEQRIKGYKCFIELYLENKIKDIKIDKFYNILMNNFLFIDFKDKNQKNGFFFKMKFKNLIKKKIEIKYIIKLIGILCEDNSVYKSIFKNGKAHKKLLEILEVPDILINNENKTIVDLDFEEIFYKLFKRDLYEKIDENDYEI
jgi:hypothetical protein